MKLQERFNNEVPGAYFLDETNFPALQDYLIQRDWVAPESIVQSAVKAGEGNMNKVLRVALETGETFIIKQARPWVEKYPQVAAPVERADIEGLFFKHTGQNYKIASFSPILLNRDTSSHVLIIQDLGDGNDLMALYESGNVIEQTTLDTLIEYLSALHQNFNKHSCDFYIENKVMRALNAEHIFNFPFMVENGLDLDEITPGLAALGKHYREHKELMENVAVLNARYLENGDTLLQGDFYPGSFLQTQDGIKIIDTEFCFFGDAEFDLGVLQAHLLMAQQPTSVIDGLLTDYAQPEGFSIELYQQYTGIEIMRRLLGLAQLPVSLNLEDKQLLLELACDKLLQS